MGPHPRRNSNDSNHGDEDHDGNVVMFDVTNGPWPCGVPKGHTCLYGSGNMEQVKITREDIVNSDAVKVVCSNESCPKSPFLHLACFTTFEETVMNYLKTQSKARAWSDKQRSHNLWSKRGYDLIFKVCECSCEQGYLRKDLDWTPPSLDLMDDENLNGVKRKRKKSKNQGKQTTITIGLPTFGSNQVDQSQSGASNRNRANSVSSNTSSGSSFASCSPLGEQLSVSPGSGSGDVPQSKEQPPRRVLMQERSRHDSGGSIFQRRVDYSSFNVLPRHKINSYHIKMEDECSIGNDETRIFILSSYASNKMNKVPCVLCKNLMTIFDRYPLIDGTFFLSPRQQNKTCIQVKVDGKVSYMTAVCMACLEGWTGNGIVCRFCLKPWTGGHLILGTMYSYDIFAAMPCCPERFQCNTCGQLVCHPDQPFNFFSDYSQMVSCPQCGVQEAHFAKSLAVYTTRDEANKQMQLAQNLQNHLTMQQQHIQAGLRVHRVNSA